MRSDRVGDIRRCKMRVVFFGHARVSMAELLGDDAKGHTTHGECRPMGMAKNVEWNRWPDLGALARCQHGAKLVRLAPHVTIGARENRVAAKLAGC